MVFADARFHHGAWRGEPAETADPRQGGGRAAANSAPGSGVSFVPPVAQKRAGRNRKGGNTMRRRTLLKGVAATAATGLFVRRAAADTPLKMGISIPL